MLALVSYLTTIDILKKQKDIMSLVSVEKCKTCGAIHEDWSCERCYYKSVIKICKGD